ncbi:50S ribosomal protein L11 methyltransferase [candidate division WOR-3 bacterium]|nr:50S ribosomal protein L11 methyltransferase [candidate division WOR-3 bacterium]
MSNQKVSFKTEEELQKAILQEKARRTPDLEIGQKYGVTFRYIERLITRSQGLNISALKVSKKISTLYPKNFKEEQTTVWSFKQRGNWATHSGEYRGNWSPYIPRNVILKYSNPGELVLDYFCGAGTTAVECKLLGRKCIAFDINDKAIELAKKNVDFNVLPQPLTLTGEEKHFQIYEPELSVSNARNLSFIENDSIELICAHPPYANIIHYTDSKEGDLSFFDIDDFLKEMSKVAKESFRVLKPGRQCVILIGDTRRKKHVIPLGFKLINVYLNAGFKLRELVIKQQHNCKTTGFWYTNSIKYNFLLLAHEYLPIFEKPKSSTPLSVREIVMDYGLVVPILEKPPLKKKLDELETTTVWILPEKDFEEQLNKNVIDRYLNGDGYSIITFISHSKNETCFSEKKGRKNEGLLFIKSPFLNNNSSPSNIEFYLQKMKEIVNRELLTITNDGFIVIQTQDVKIDGYVEPLGKRVVDMLTFDNLWLKEIVFVTQEGANSNIQNSGDYLKIIHQYILVYEVTSEEEHIYT